MTNEVDCHPERQRRIAGRTWSFAVAFALAFLVAGHSLAAQQHTLEQPPSILCALDRHLGPLPKLVVDLRLHSGQTNRKPNAADSAAVLLAGGRIMRAFNVAVLRVALDTATLRRLLSGRSGIADVAYPVADTARQDVQLQVFFHHSMTESDSLRLLHLGASVFNRMPMQNIVAIAAPDSIIPRIEAVPDVEMVRARAMTCVVVNAGNRRVR